MATVLDDIVGGASQLVGRVLVSSRFTPAYEIPVSRPAAPAPGGPPGPATVHLVKESTGQLLQPTVRVWFSGSDESGPPDYTVAPWGEADGSWAGFVLLLAGLAFSHAIAYWAGSK